MYYKILILVALAGVAEGAPTIQRYGDSDSGRTVLVKDAALGHTAQLLPSEKNAEIDEDIANVFEQLENLLATTGSAKSDLVKLNLYANSDAAYSKIIEQMNQWSSQPARPAVTFVTTDLPRGSRVALDAVFVIRSKHESNKVKHFEFSPNEPASISLLPKGDVVYVSGQAEPGDLATATAQTLSSLRKTLQFVGLDRSDIVQVKCFLQPMEDVEIVNREIVRFFEDEQIPAVVHVEWIAGGQRPIEIELIAAAPLTKTDETVTFLTPAEMKSSSVFSRVARIHGNRRAYVGGLTSSKEGTGAEQVHDIYQNLTRRLSPTRSNLRHLAKATYYVTDADASSELNEIRPHYYDPQRPPAASKLMVRGIGKEQRSISIDFIGAPESPPRSVLTAKSEKLKPTRTEVYKRVGERDLQLHIFEPANHKATDKRPVFLAIHGGGWTGGNAKQFYPFAAHFAEQGMLGMSLEYRLRSPATGTTVFDCVEDAKSAVRWIRENAERLGVDANRIVGMGGSAGGHLAISTALFNTSDEERQGSATSSIPNAIVAMYPVIDTSASGYGQAKIGERWRELSPVHNVREGLPPMLVFHGTGDSVTPFSGANEFHTRTVAAGNECKLIIKPAGRHGYIIFNEAELENALDEMEMFLSSHEMLDSKER